MKFKHIIPSKRLYLAVLAKTLIVFMAVLTISVAIGAWNKIKESRYIGQEIEIRNTITVSDQAEVYAKPDLAMVQFSAVTEAKSVSQAMSQNTAKMNAVIGAVKNFGVDEKDLKTTSFNINPLYEYDKNGKRTLYGYEVRQSLEVKIRDLSKIGQLIEQAAAAGANQVGDLWFAIDKEDELKAQAREEAIKKAKQKAELLAEQLGVKLVRIISFSESGGIPYYYEKSGYGIGGGAEAAPQIETGQNKIEANVAITYEIN
jgi:uncharacterized protein YggE